MFLQNRRKLPSKLPEFGEKSVIKIFKSGESPSQNFSKQGEYPSIPGRAAPVHDEEKKEQSVLIITIISDVINVRRKKNTDRQ